MRRFDSKLCRFPVLCSCALHLGSHFCRQWRIGSGCGTFGAPHVAWGRFARFVAYTGQLNWFVPKATIRTPGYFGDLRRNSSGCSAAARMADADRSTLKRSSALAICTYDDGGSWDQGTLDASVVSAAGGAFLLASCGEYPFSIDYHWRDSVGDVFTHQRGPSIRRPSLLSRHQMVVSLLTSCCE